MHCDNDAVPTVQCPLLPVKTLVEAEERRLLAQLLGVALVPVLEHQTRPRHAPVTHHAKLGRPCFYQPHQIKKCIEKDLLAC